MSSTEQVNYEMAINCIEGVRQWLGELVNSGRILQAEYGQQRNRLDMAHNAIIALVDELSGPDQKLEYPGQEDYEHTRNGYGSE